MTEASGFPVPTLPPPGSAPAAPVPVMPSPTQLAPPTDGACDLAAPAASAPLTAPSLPEAGGPMLPPSGVTSTTPAGAASAPTESAVSAGPEAPADVPAKKSLTIAKVLPVLLIVGAGAVGLIGYLSMSGDSADDAGAPLVTVAPVASSPLLVPINDAKAVVEQINENSAEQEVLGELGLGPLGETTATEAPGVDVVDRSVGAAVPVHAGDVIHDDLVSVLGAPTFRYQVQRGSAVEQSVWVDASSGNREVFDGTTYVRIVGGTVFHTVDPTGAWTSDPALMPTEPLALLGGMVTIDQVLPEGLLAAISATTASDQSATGRYVFIDSELADDARAAWLASWGFDPAIGPVAVDGVTDGVPDSARPGLIVVSVVTSADGVVTNLAIEAPGIGERVSYRLLGASMEPLTIGPPATVAE